MSEKIDVRIPIEVRGLPEQCGGLTPDSIITVRVANMMVQIEREAAYQRAIEDAAKVADKYLRFETNPAEIIGNEIRSLLHANKEEKE